MPPSKQRHQYIVATIDNIYDTIPADYDERLRKELLNGKNQLAIILNRFGPAMPAVLDIGHGWLPKIIKLDQKLNILCPTYTISQIKEKFGTLRYYAHCTPFQNLNDSTRDIIYEAFMDLISHTEHATSFVCEVCGDFGERYRDDKRWLSTRCSKHAPHGALPAKLS